MFNQIKTGNGTFTVSANDDQYRTGMVGATTVSNPAAWDGGTYSINFSAPGAYQVLEGATVVTSGSYTDGDTIAFNGVQVTLSGTARRGRFLQCCAEHQPEPVHNRAESGDGAAIRRGHIGIRDRVEQFDQ